MDEPSPSKKRRLDTRPLHPADSLSEQHTLTQQPPEQHGLQPLPPPLALLALAASLRAAAFDHLPSLAKRPSSSSPSSQQRYAHAWASYYQLSVAAVAVLRSAGSLAAATGEFRGGRVELRAWAGVAECWADWLEGVGKASGYGGHVNEAEEALTRAHPSLSSYMPALSFLQLRLSLCTNKPLKHVRQLLRHLLSPLPPPSPACTDAQAAAYYAAQAFAATLPHPEVSNADRRDAWRTIADGAAKRRHTDGEVLLLARLAEARLALDDEDYTAAAELLAPVESWLATEAKPGSPSSGGGRGEAVIVTSLMRTVILAQTGDVKGARDRLKETHKLLDAPRGARVGAEGIFTAPIRQTATSTSPPLSVLAYYLPPHATLYPFTFYLSSVLHLDALGRSPRALLFGEEGLRVYSNRLNGREEYPGPVRSLAQVGEDAVRTVRLKVETHVTLAHLHTLRGEFDAADKDLESAVRAAAAYELWDGSVAGASATRERTALALGLARLARAARGGQDELQAAKCFEAVIASISPGPLLALATPSKSKASPMTSPHRQHTLRLAQLSLLLLHFSVPALASTAITSTQALLHALTGSSNSSSAGHEAAWASLATSLASALSATQITAQKTALSAALTAANGLQANAVRAGVLALLASLFTFTREGEAHKMLVSSYKLSSTMGPATRVVSVSLPSPTAAAVAASNSSIHPGAGAVKAEPTRSEEVKMQVGMARLQAWAGERLLDALRTAPPSTPNLPQQIRQQAQANEACRVWLEALEQEAML
ncbi:hypothetical protein JCM10207_008641 [Rhodosporidiobolus poonsookiae]